MRPDELSIEQLVELKQKLGDEGRAYVDVLLRKKRQQFWADRKPSFHVVPFVPLAEPRTWYRKDMRRLEKSKAYLNYVEQLRRYAKENGIVVGDREVRVVFNIPLKPTLHAGIKARMRGKPATKLIDRPEKYIRGVATALGCKDEQIQATLLWADKGSLILEVVG